MVLIVLSIFIYIISLSYAEPPTPHGISGYIYHADGTTQVPLGTKYTINDSTSGDFISSQTSFPIPGWSGYYSETIQGSNNDNVTIISWNLTHYGVRKVVLLGTMDGVNIKLNLSRDTEPTVNITFPADNTIRNDSAYFKVYSNLKLYGSSGVNCKVNISYSNQSVLGSYNDQPTGIDLLSIASGWTSTIVWNVTSKALGSSDISVNFTCDGMGMKFETLNNTYTLKNITIEDTTPPNITLISPKNNHITNDASVVFEYNVTDNSDLLNCSLYIDNVFQQANYTAQKSQILSFDDTIAEGNHTWYIECYDTIYHRGLSSIYNIILDTKARTIQTDAPDHVHGDTVYIYGYNWTNNSMVTINLTLSNGTSVLWNSTASNKVLNTSYFIDYPNPIGVTDIFAYEYLYNYYNATTSFTIDQRTQSLITDKIDYGHDELVYISGHNFTINGTIEIIIYKNDSNTTGPGFPAYTLANVSGDFNYAWNTTDTCSAVYRVEAVDQNYTLYYGVAYFNITAGEPCSLWDNVLPNVTSVFVDDQFLDLIDKIDLNAGGITTVFCNVTGYDEDGYADIIIANATFYSYLNSSDDPDNNNTHYTDANCTITGDDGANERYFQCIFNITYYATNGTWICNASVYDSYNEMAHGDDTTYINELYAINLTPLIDFGDVPTGNISNEITSFVTNIGNVEVDIGIDAYADFDGDGAAMNCTNANISLNDEKYSLVPGTLFDLMTPVTDTMANIASFNLGKQINSTSSVKELYWKVRPTPGSLGDCQGVVVFTAVSG